MGYRGQGGYRSGSGGGTPPASAVQVDVSGEISALTAKATPVGADVLLIEDSAASNAKKKVTASSLLAIGSTDSTAIHSGTSGEISGVTAKSAPIGADLLLIEDSAATNAKKSATITNVLGAAGITNALSAASGGLASGDLVAVEDISASNIKAKATVAAIHGVAGITNALAAPSGGLAAGDLFESEDVSASNIKTKATVTDLHGVAGVFAAYTNKSSPVAADVVPIEDSASSNAKKYVTFTNLFGIGGIYAAYTNKATPVGADIIPIEDSAASNAKKYILISSLPAAVVTKWALIYPSASQATIGANTLVTSFDTVADGSTSHGITVSAGIVTLPANTSGYRWNIEVWLYTLTTQDAFGTWKLYNAPAGANTAFGESADSIGVAYPAKYGICVPVTGRFTGSGVFGLRCTAMSPGSVTLVGAVGATKMMIREVPT